MLRVVNANHTSVDSETITLFYIISLVINPFTVLQLLCFDIWFFNLKAFIQKVQKQLT